MGIDEKPLEIPPFHGSAAMTWQPRKRPDPSLWKWMVLGHDSVFKFPRCDQPAAFDWVAEGMAI
jgi:hypothetical protein